MKHTIKACAERRDVSGKRIDLHGSSVIYENGVYYWYGENKEFTDGKNGIWTYGIKCYASADLVNWEDKGYLIPPSEDENSPLNPKNYIDRPHIVYNEKTKKYVCWLKIMEKNDEQTVTVLTADSFFGPYTVVRTGYKPFGMNAGDFDLALDKKSRKVYYYFEKVHTELICAELSEDYTKVGETYTSHFTDRSGVPYVREAPAHFERNGKHYLITSGTTGYFPNPSEVARGDSFSGSFEVLGNPFVGEESDTSFHSQVSCVFQVAGKDFYIAIADRWLPDYMHIPYADVEKAFLLFKAGKKEEALAVNPDLIKAMFAPTCRAETVWLPVVFKDGVPRIEWKNEWEIDFE